MTTRTPTTFLDLPGELRNTIYESTVADHAHLPIRVLEGGSPSAPALAPTSQEVRAEFLSLWNAIPFNGRCSRHLHARVLDLDFVPLLKFLKKSAFRAKYFHVFTIDLFCADVGRAVQHSAGLEGLLRVLAKVAERMRFKLRCAAAPDVRAWKAVLQMGLRVRGTELLRDVRRAVEGEVRKVRVKK